MINRNVFRVKINQNGSDSTMWYTRQLGQEYIVELGSCARMVNEEYMASGWCHFNVIDDKGTRGNAIELTDCEIVEQFPNLVEFSVSKKKPADRTVNPVTETPC